MQPSGEWSGRCATWSVAGWSRSWGWQQCFSLPARAPPDTAAGAAGDSPPAAVSSLPTSPSPSLPTVGAVLADTLTFALSSPSARVEGVLPRGGARVEVVLEGNAAGTDQQVVVDAGDDGVARVRTVGEAHWLGGDEDFWRAQGVPDADLGEAGRTWLVVSEERARSLAPWTVRTLLTDLFALPGVVAMESSTDSVTADEVDGRAAWMLGSAGRPRLWVAGDGSGELLRVVVPDGTEVRFTRWGRAQTFVAPGQYDVRRA